MDLSTVPRAIAAGLAYVTEDRKHLGLLLGDDIRKNITLANLAGVSRRGVYRRHARAGGGGRLPRHSCASAATTSYQEAGTLSGGNQQKVVLSNGCSRARRC